MGLDHPKPPKTRPTWQERWSVFVADVRRLAHFAAKLGVVAALVCHFLPPHYHSACQAVERLCGGGR